MKPASHTRNIASNAAGYMVGVVVAFLLSPFVVHSLGDSAFGIWTLVVSVTGYYGLLDIGIRSAVGQYATRYWAVRDVDGVNRTMNTALGMIGLVAVAIFGVSAIVALKAPVWFDLLPGQARAGQWAILIVGAGVGLNFPMIIMGVSTYAAQRFDVDNGIGILDRLLSAGLIVWLLQDGYGLLGIAIATTGSSLLTGLLRVWFAFRLLPGLRISPRFLSRRSVHELVSFGTFNFFVNAADRFVTHLDAIVIGIFMTTSAITYYAVASNLVPYYLALVYSVAFTMTPYATSRDAEGDRSALQDLWIRGTRGILTLAAVVGCGLFFLGQEFLGLWMGERFVAGGEYASSGLILRILVVAAFFRLAMTCGTQICFAVREVRFLAGLAFAEAATNLVLSIMLVGRWGLVGVAIGTLVPTAIAYLWIQPAFLSKRLDVSMSRLWRPSLVPGALVIVVMAVCSMIVNALIPDAKWSTFVLKCALVGVPGLVVAYGAGTKPAEKVEFRSKLSRLIGGEGLVER